MIFGQSKVLLAFWQILQTFIICSSELVYSQTNADSHNFLGVGNENILSKYAYFGKTILLKFGHLFILTITWRWFNHINDVFS